MVQRDPDPDRAETYGTMQQLLSLIDPDILCASSVVGGVLLLSLMSKAFEATKSVEKGNAAAAKELVHQHREWAHMASQDKNEAFRLRHSALSLAYLQAARACCCDETIHRATGIDVHASVREAEATMRKSTVQVSRGLTASSGEKVTRKVVGSGNHHHQHGSNSTPTLPSGALPPPSPPSVTWLS